jgi:hypothetical protein
MRSTRLKIKLTLSTQPVLSENQVLTLTLISPSINNVHECRLDTRTSAEIENHLPDVDLASYKVASVDVYKEYSFNKYLLSIVIVNWHNVLEYSACC